MRIFTGELPYSRLTLLRRDEVCELEKFCKFEPYAGARVASKTRWVSPM